MRRTIFVPVGYAEAADRIAVLVNRGALKLQPHWLTKQACQNFIDFLPNGGWADGIMLRATAVQVQVAGDAERIVSPPAISVSMTDRRDGGCVSGKPIIEGADGWNGPLPVIGLALASRSFGGQEARHVA